MKGNIEVLTFDTESATQLSLLRNLGEKDIIITLASYKKNGLNKLSRYIRKRIYVSNWNEQPEVFINELIEIGKKKHFSI